MQPPMMGLAVTGVILGIIQTVHCSSNDSQQSSQTAGSLHANPYSSQPAMVPATHWDTPTGNMSMLQPSSALSLYYTKDGSADPRQNHSFAQVDSNTTHPTVLLAHSKYMTDVTCAPGSITIKCPNQNAFSYISTHWPSAPPFIVGTFSNGCGNSNDQHSFFMVTNVSVSAKTNTIVLQAQPQLAMTDTMAEVEISWGQYTVTSTQNIPRSDDTTSPVASGSPTASNPGSDTTVDPGFFNATQGAGNESCGPPPSLMVDGFYAAGCGSPTFDQDIDNAIGYLVFNESSFSDSLKEYAPGLADDYLPSDNNDFAPVQTTGMRRKRRSASLRRRGFWSSATDKVKSVFKGTVKGASQAVGKFVGRVTNAASNALAIDGVATTSIPFSVGPANDANTIFGAAKTLFSSKSGTANSQATINVYCVGCGVQGLLQLSGRVRFTIKNGLTQANVGLNGNINAGLQIGIDANAGYSNEFRYPLVSVAAPPGFTITGLFVIGPIVSLDAVVTVGLSAQGRILAGATVGIPDFRANLDLVNGDQSSTSGFSPKVERVFRVDADFAATAGLEFPLGVGLGVSIPPIKFHKTASLYNKAYIAATITASNSNQDGNCKGVGYSLQVGNQLFADVFGIFKKTLVDYPYPLGGQCFSLPTSGTTGRGKRNLLSRQEDPLSVITNSDPNNPDNTPRFDEISAQALAFADQLNSALNVTGNFGVASSDPNATFIPINDVTGTYGLTSDILTGNIYLTNNGSGTLFAASSNESLIVGDDYNRYAHYYPDTMAKYGVSRYRMSNFTMIPQDSELLALVPVNNATVYAAFDTQGNTFLPVTCDIENQYAKIFMVNADTLDQGLQTLKDPALRYTITGGIVDDCYYIPFAVSG